MKLTITKVRRERVTLPAAGFAGFCPVCQRNVEILSLSQAAAILEVGDETLEALLASGTIHGIQTVTGSIAVCKHSLWQQGRVVAGWSEAEEKENLP